MQSCSLFSSTKEYTIKVVREANMDVDPEPCPNISWADQVNVVETINQSSIDALILHEAPMLSTVLYYLSHVKLISLVILTTPINLQTLLYRAATLELYLFLAQRNFLPITWPILFSLSTTLSPTLGKGTLQVRTPTLFYNSTHLVMQYGTSSWQSMSLNGTNSNP